MPIDYHKQIRKHPMFIINKFCLRSILFANLLGAKLKQWKQIENEGKPLAMEPKQYPWELDCGYVIQDCKVHENSGVLTTWKQR